MNFQLFVLQNGTKTEMRTFVFPVIAFDPVRILTCSVPHKDCLNLCFVKYNNVVGKKMIRNSHKMPITRSTMK